MSLIVETGGGVANCNVYGQTSDALADAMAYHRQRGNQAWLLAGADIIRERALIRAFDYLTIEYRHNWKGYRFTTTQGGDWPRAYCEIDDKSSGGMYPFYFPIDDVPDEVCFAQFEAALLCLEGDLLPNIEPQVLREKIDVIEIEYNPNASPSTIYRRVGGLLAPYIDGKSSVMRSNVRT